MPPTPHRIAQTSTEAKKQHKKNGLLLPARQQKQLERGYELEQRAARLREAEDRRKLAKKKREEREAKEERVREQLGVGLANQMIGYSHTQAQLKRGMEAFLGVNKAKEETLRRKQNELLGKMEAISESLDKEPWDFEDENEIASVLPDAPTPVAIAPLAASLSPISDVDEEALLAAHDLAVSTKNASLKPAAQSVSRATIPQVNLTSDQVHGPINKMIESILDKMPDPVIELLSQDISLRLSDWTPEPSLLHRLNPIGMPPHRLRITLGCVVTLLRDLNTSSQLSKSQHLRILRAENDRLECLVLDGQLAGTKTVLTRVSFQAKYKNQDQFPFQRLQYPVRLATNYTLTGLPKQPQQSGFKLPSVVSAARLSSNSRPTKMPPPKVQSRVQPNPDFRMPGLPASKSATHIHVSVAPKTSNASPRSDPVVDCWDEFLESGTQIAREIANEPVTKKSKCAVVKQSPLSIGNGLPPLSTQDLSFSLDDLDTESPTDETPAAASNITSMQKPPSLPSVVKPVSAIPARLRETGVTKASPSPPLQQKIAIKVPVEVPQLSNPTGARTSAPLPGPPMPAPSRRPPSVSDRPGLKRKTWTPPKDPVHPERKRQCPPTTVVRPAPSPPKQISLNSYHDLMISTQDAMSFFDDDDSMTFGSPPIAA